MKEFKTCSVCGQEKHISMFQPATSQCLPCYRVKKSEYCKKRYAQKKANGGILTRRCEKCGLEKEPSSFTGNSAWCNTCYDKPQMNKDPRM